MTTGHQAVASLPLAASTSRKVMEGGGSRAGAGTTPSAVRMKSAQIGSAAWAPESRSTSRWSNPTHTSATSRGVYPTNQVSRPSFVVPVFPATAPSTPSARADAPVPRSITPSSR